MLKEKSNIYRNCLGLSDNPRHPQGFSQFSVCQEGKHLGKKINFNDLSEHIQKHIISRLTEGGEL